MTLCTIRGRAPQALCAVALTLVLALGVEAKLRTRYCYPRNHDSEAGSGGSPQSYSLEWMQKVLPGIWDGYDAETGFDGVPDSDEGSFTHAPYVSAAYWIDSVYCSSMISLRKNAPLVDGWASSGDLLDASYQLSGDGYFVLAAGALDIQQAGTYEFRIDGNDGVLLWVDKNDDGAIDITSEVDAVNGYLRYTSDDVAWAWGFNDDNYTDAVTFSRTGLHRALVWYWDWGEIGHAELSWKTPGSGEFVPVPCAAFGQKSLGLPGVRITRVEIDGVAASPSDWGNLDVAECVPVTFHTEVTNPGAGVEYRWDFYGDGSRRVTTTNPVIRYNYAYDPSLFLIQPSVTVVRNDGRISDPSSQKDVIFIWLSDDPTISACVPPNIPDGLAVEAVTATSVTLSWEAGAGASQYRLYRAASLSGSYTRIATTSQTRYTDTGLEPSTDYYYKVDATNGAGYSSKSSAVQASTAAPSAPATPAGLSAAALSSSSVYLSWSGVPDAGWYVVYRSTTPAGSYERVDSVAAVSCTDDALSSATTYYYRVAAGNEHGISGLCEPVHATTAAGAEPPDAPSALSATALSSSAIEVSWDAVPYATGYVVYRSPTENGTYGQIATVAQPSHLDSNLAPEMTCYYKVSADNAYGESQPAGPVAATTPAEPQAPATPAFPAAVALSPTVILLSWGNTAGATVYEIYRCPTENGTYGLIAAGADTFHVDSNLVPGTTCYYRVAARNDIGVSARTEPVSATTGEPPNHPPAIENVDSVTAYSDSVVEWVAWAMDPDDDSITFAFEGLPAWTSATDDSTLLLAPAETDGDTLILVIARDEHGLADTLALRVRVKHPTRASAGRIPATAGVFGISADPATRSVTIAYGLTRPDRVSVAIHAPDGRMLRKFERNRGPGYHTINWNGRTGSGGYAGAGTYIVVIRARAFHATRKLVMTR